MNRIAAIAGLGAVAAIALAATTGVITVTTRPSGVLSQPPNFFTANSNAINAVIPAVPGSGTVTSVSATSEVAGLGFSGSPIVGAVTLVLTGAVAGGSGSVTNVGLATTVGGLGISGSPITSGGTMAITGIVAEASIDASLARDSEMAAAYQPLDADLADLADGSLTGSKVGSGIDGGNITAGTVADARIDSAVARDAEMAAAYQPLDADLTDLADGSLTGSKVGSGIDDDNVSFDDADNLWTASAVGPALEELNDSINAGVPNGTSAKIHWSQLLGVPSGFSDGTDDGAGGGGATTNARIWSWTAADMVPGTNATTQAQFKVLGDGIPTLEFDGTTGEEISMIGTWPRDAASTSYALLSFASDDAGATNTVCWEIKLQSLSLRGIDTNLWTTAYTWTSNIPGTARVPTNIIVPIASAPLVAGGTNDWGKPYMMRVSRLPGSDTSSSNAYLLSVDHRFVP